MAWRDWGRINLDMVGCCILFYFFSRSMMIKALGTVCTSSTLCIPRNNGTGEPTENPSPVSTFTHIAPPTPSPTMTKRDKKEKAAEPEETAPAEKKAKTDTQEEASAEAAAAPPAAEPPSIFDHISLPVSDYGKSIEFYKAALKPLGVEVKMEFGEGRERSAGLGVVSRRFWRCLVRIGTHRG